jgi:hypothetical protein
MATAIDRFGHDGQPEAYVKYRPRYPKALIDCVLAEASSRDLTGLMVDVATGNGQVRSTKCQL